MKYLKGIILCILLSMNLASANERFTLKLGMTTSLDNAGVVQLIKEHFENTHPDIELKIIVSGTGRVLSFLESRDLDLAIVHNKARELQFLSEYPGERIELFTNEFILVGPDADPAGVRDAASIQEALLKIHNGGHRFISRGDDSGTHIAEQQAWSNTGIPFAESPGYMETGAGSGQSLNTAAAMNAYMFIDSSTFHMFNNKRDLVRLTPGGLLNTYSLIIPTSNLTGNTLEQVSTFRGWLLSHYFQRLFSDLDPNIIRYAVIPNE